jgi:universal stress protein A
MTNVRTILVPIDFSAESRAAVRHAHDLARLFHSRIHLLHVTTNPSVPPWATDIGHALQRIQEDDRTRARFALASLIDEERLDPVTTRSVVLTGRPGDVIPVYAEEVSADLIVMGLHAEHAGSRLVGHITDRVMRAVTCPVLAVPERHGDDAALRERLEAELAG